MEKGNKQEAKPAERKGAIPKSITITPRQQRFIEARSINLSKFLQKRLDEEIAMQGWKGEDKNG